MFDFSKKVANFDTKPDIEIACFLEKSDKNNRHSKNGMSHPGYTSLLHRYSLSQKKSCFSPPQGVTYRFFDACFEYFLPVFWLFGDACYAHFLPVFSKKVLVFVVRDVNSSVGAGCLTNNSSTQ